MCLNFNTEARLMQPLLFEEGGSGEGNILKTSLFCNLKTRALLYRETHKICQGFITPPFPPSFVFGKILCKGQKGVLYLPTLTSISLPAEVKSSKAKALEPNIHLIFTYASSSSLRFTQVSRSVSHLEF